MTSNTTLFEKAINGDKQAIKKIFEKGEMIFDEKGLLKSDFFGDFLNLIVEIEEKSALSHQIRSLICSLHGDLMDKAFQEFVLNRHVGEVEFDHIKMAHEVLKRNSIEGFTNRLYLMAHSFSDAKRGLEQRKEQLSKLENEGHLTQKQVVECISDRFRQLIEQDESFCLKSLNDVSMSYMKLHIGALGKTLISLREA